MYKTLSPCPFCGGTNIKIYENCPMECSSYEIMCGDCMTDVIIIAQSKQEAITKWNRRN